jgi:hypothetical protein
MGINDTFVIREYGNKIPSVVKNRKSSLSDIFPLLANTHRQLRGNSLKWIFKAARDLSIPVNRFEFYINCLSEELRQCVNRIQFLVWLFGVKRSRIPLWCNQAD